MKKGPNRKISPSGIIHVYEQEPISLGVLAKVDFASRPDLVRDIQEVWDKYRSLVVSEQSAPERATIDRKVQNMIAAVHALRDAIASFEGVAESFQERLEFQDAIGELLRPHNLSRLGLFELLEELKGPLNPIESYLSAIQTELSERHRAGKLVVASTQEYRADFFRQLHRVLSHHGLDESVGQKSLLVQVIMRLERRESSDAEEDSGRRKKLAGEVRSAVKARKGAPSSAPDAREGSV